MNTQIPIETTTKVVSFSGEFWLLFFINNVSFEYFDLNTSLLSVF